MSPYVYGLRLQSAKNATEQFTKIAANRNTSVVFWAYTVPPFLRGKADYISNLQENACD